jgi:hypothetical protein
MKDQNNNKRQKTNKSIQTEPIKKNIFKLIDEFDSSDSESDSDSEIEDTNDKWTYEEIKKDINNINDLIELGKMYDPNKKVRYNINLYTLNKLVDPLERLNSMIGLSNIKENIVGQIIYHMQNLDENNDMMHTVIQGSPGVGKTMLGRILGDIYFNMGILKGNRKRSRSGNRSYNFKIVKRSDLIGKYLGHTAVKTQKVIDSCQGGVLFIDEAYSLGNPEGRDSFSKECIDTLNQNLTENKGNLLCIIAGYKDALEKCFFSYNEGLSRRFTFRYTIDPYSEKELREIFIKMIKEIGWSVDDKNIPLSFFKDNYDSFKNMAGDVETLIFNCKIEHSKRVFCLPEQRKKLNYEDIKKGFEVFCKNRGNKKETNEVWKAMYI